MLDAGRREAALVLWESVVEIFHVGSPSGEVLQTPHMPPIPCTRCERRLELDCSTKSRAQGPNIRDCSSAMLKGSRQAL